jgi:hypothetical protein
MPVFKYKMRARVWLYPGPAAWHFVTLPKKQSAEIRALFGKSQHAFGSLPVVATVGKTSWKTSIWVDKKSGAYLLPLKADVRKKEGISLDQMLDFAVQINP